MHPGAPVRARTRDRARVIVISDDASEQGARRELSRRGFADGADYQAARPGYPPAALEYLVRSLGLGERDRVVDLGAGTGLLTRELRERFADVTAIEPSAGMREVLAAAVAGVRVLDGRDVAIPLPDACAEAVFVAQAFHWFDAPRALEEIHRLLVPGGGLALLWNNRDESVGWVAEFSRAMRWDRCSPYSAATDYAAGTRRGSVRTHRAPRVPLCPARRPSAALSTGLVDELRRDHGCRVSVRRC